MPNTNLHSETATRPQTQTSKPPMYKVYLLNDDYTPMDFVALVLRRFFNKNVEEAKNITLQIHNSGIGTCGLYPFEIAETKASNVINLSRKHQHPLQCRIEKKEE
ncbi:MAG: ATP-dependent Clp protease adapter ClpS [Alphaproteobacteria bacterium]|nr:ATP-dependent Clp protease adapter ClpS [Alphaproteobacteria bacterium]